MPEHNEIEQSAEQRLRKAALHGVQIRISAQQAAAIVDLLRRLRQENNTPYQCYWRDRAFAAEAKTAETQRYENHS